MSIRTAIFMGLIYVGDAIGTPSYMTNEKYVGPLVTALLLFIITDIIDFLRNK